MGLKREREGRGGGFRHVFLSEVNGINLGGSVLVDLVVCGTSGTVFTRRTHS